MDQCYSVEIDERPQMKILKVMTRASWYVKNLSIQNAYSLIKEEFKKAKENYNLKLEIHPDSLARHLAYR